MKKFILSLIALVCCMGINAQVIKVYKNGSTTPVVTYTNTTTDKYKVVFEEKPTSDPNLLPGEFSVSGSKRVKFTKGNLQATYNSQTRSYTWGLAANQYSYVGNAAGNTSIASQANDAVVDLFCWSTNAISNNWGIYSRTSASDFYTIGSFIDWGNIFTSYSTLSETEWTYLLNTRTVNGGTGEGKSYQRTTLALSNNSTVYGMLIAPDSYTGPLGATTSWSAWQTMENAGVVFLPAAGFRSNATVGEATTNGYYWSSTSYSDTQARNMGFGSGSVSLIPSNRYSGRSVRLVSVVTQQ